MKTGGKTPQNPHNTIRPVPPLSSWTTPRNPEENKNRLLRIPDDRFGSSNRPDSSKTFSVYPPPRTAPRNRPRGSPRPPRHRGSRNFFYLLDTPHGTTITSGNTPDQLISKINLTQGITPRRLFPTTGNGQTPCSPPPSGGYLPSSCKRCPYYCTLQATPRRAVRPYSYPTGNAPR